MNFFTCENKIEYIRLHSFTGELQTFTLDLLLPSTRSCLSIGFQSVCFIRSHFVVLSPGVVGPPGAKGAQGECVFKLQET